MKNKPIVLFASSIFLTIYINMNIFYNHYSHFLFILWIISIFFFLLAFLRQFSFPDFNKKQIIPIFCIILLPLIVRISHYNLNRIHGDDLMAAYFSTTQDFPRINFFSGIPTVRTDWESQFPSPFFILQKIFFILFGESLLTVKLSIIPYVLVVTIMIFLITKSILNEKVAAISVFLYSFFAINLYLETIGLWVISGTAVFLVFFYFLICNLKKNNAINSMFMGLFSGFSYLFYFNSYIAFPIMTLVFFCQLLIIKKLYVVRNFLISIVGFAVVISPFFTYANTFENYFTDRLIQVSLLTGAWSSISKDVSQGKSIFPFLKDNIFLTIKSFYIDGIGGQGGVNFGRLALFESFSLYLFLSGLLFLFILVPRKIELLLLLLVVIFSIIPIILSIPPPAYHRFALAFPFINIISALPFYVILKVLRIHSSIKYILIFMIIIIYGAKNQSYYLTSVKAEKYHPILYVSDYINKNFPVRNVYVAAYPGYAFDKIYYFSREKNATGIYVEYHETFLAHFNRNEKYVYVVLFPDVFNDRFSRADPNGRVINLSADYSLFVN